MYLMIIRIMVNELACIWLDSQRFQWLHQRFGFRHTKDFFSDRI